MVLPRVDIQSNLKASDLLQATETIFDFGELVKKFELRTYEVLVKGRANNDTKTGPMPATPPNLLGILRRIA
jgi:hypothetical protein